MSCCEGRGCSQCDSPEHREINRVARLLIAEWERVEGKPVTVSYVATFVDMARVAITDARVQLARYEALEASVITLCEVATDDAFTNGPLEPSRPQLFAALLSTFTALDALSKETP